MYRNESKQVADPATGIGGWSLICFPPLFVPSLSVPAAKRPPLIQRRKLLLPARVAELFLIRNFIHQQNGSRIEKNN